MSQPSSLVHFFFLFASFCESFVLEFLGLRGPRLPLVPEQSSSLCLSRGWIVIMCTTCLIVDVHRDDLWMTQTSKIIVCRCAVSVIYFHISAVFTGGFHGSCFLGRNWDIFGVTFLYKIVFETLKVRLEPKWWSIWWRDETPSSNLVIPLNKVKQKVIVPQCFVGSF